MSTKVKKIDTLMTRRTIMSDELQKLFACKPDTSASISDYYEAVVIDNCLLKSSMSSRKLTFSYLKNMYALDIEKPVFRVFRRLWTADKTINGLLCLQYACFVDSVLKESVSYFLSKQINSLLTTEDTYNWVIQNYPGRFSITSATTIAKDLNSSWYQGHFFKGTHPRIRIKPIIAKENVVFALFLAYLAGYRGMLLLDNEFTTFLELPPNEILTFAESAAKCGLLTLRHLGDVLEVQFQVNHAAGGGL